MTDAERRSLDAIISALRTKALYAHGMAPKLVGDRIAPILAALAVDYGYFANAIQHVLDGGEISLKQPETLQ